MTNTDPAHVPPGAHLAEFLRGMTDDDLDDLLVYITGEVRRAVDDHGPDSSHGAFCAAIGCDVNAESLRRLRVMFE